MKKVLAGVIIVMFVFVFFNINVNAQSSAIGTWKTVASEGPDKGKAKSHIEIFEKSGVYFGKIVKLLLKPQDTLCDKCKGDLKNKPMVGMVNIQNMKKTGSTDEELGEAYAGGTVMNPDDGKIYKCKFWVKGDVLTLRGYIGFIYKTQIWSRVK
jgi:Uncharacterized protein conserved in bacteria